VCSVSAMSKKKMAKKGAKPLNLPLISTLHGENPELFYGQNSYIDITNANTTYLI